MYECIKAGVDLVRFVEVYVGVFPATWWIGVFTVELPGWDHGTWVRYGRSAVVCLLYSHLEGL